VPRLVEPGAHPGTAAVADADLEDLQVAARLLLGDALDRSDQGDFRPGLGVREVGEVPPGQVATRVVLKKVADGVVAEGRLDGLGKGVPHPGRAGERGGERISPRIWHAPEYRAVT
jgi:hypothetical protein